MLIYLFIFPNGKYYVGRTKNTFEQRCIEHKARAKKGYQHPLYYAISKYGWENIEKQVLEFVEDYDTLVVKELEYIIKYNSLENGYNLTINTQIGGDNWKGRRNSKEYLEFTEKMKTLTVGKNNGMFGKTHSQDTSKKMKEKAKGRYTLPWFISKYGSEEGELKYKERNIKLKNRDYSKMKDPKTGIFTKNKEK